MKYCTKCGAEVADEAVVCVKCGCALENATPQTTTTKEPSTLQTVAKVFMILGCIMTGWCLIPLCWTIPMTVSYSKKIKANEPVSIGFKICALLFVSLIGGVLMLFDNND